MRTAWVIGLVLMSCGDGDGGGDYYTEEGECEAPAGASDLGSESAALWDDGCFVEGAELRIVESDADWQALFDCTEPQPIPAGIDLVNERAAVVNVMCSPTTFRFAAETDAEMIVGVKTGISGACIGNVIVVPLPRSTKPVRVAHCWDQCHGECPPVP